MSISSRITEMEQHIGNAYDKIEDLGIDLTNVNKNINNISSMLENVWEEYPKVTATDVEEASINGTKKGRINIDLKGQTEQEQLDGKNLFDKDNVNVLNNIFISGDRVLKQGVNNATVYISCKPNTTYTIQKVADNVFRAGTTQVTPEVNVTVDDYNNNPTGNVITLTTSNNAKYLVVFIRNEGTSKSLQTILNSLQIEEGSTATEYEPYCGGIPSPNPDFPQQIKNVTGNNNIKIQNKNLWNYELEQGEYDINGEKVSTFVWIVNKVKIPVKSNTKYTITQKEHPSQYRIIYWNNDNYLSRENNTQNVTTGYSSFTFTTPENCNEIYIQFRTTLEKIATGTYEMKPNDISNIQLEQGTTATSYVPHQEQNLPFTFAEGQRAMQGTTLQDDGIDNKRKQVVFDGSADEDWKGATLIDNVVRFQCDSISGQRISNIGQLCSHFIYSYSNEDNQHFYINPPNGAIFIFIDKNIAKTTNELRNWLSNNSITFEYYLPEEEIIPYNETQASQYEAIKNARSYNDQTNISQTNDELPFILDIEALKGETTNEVNLLTRNNRKTAQYLESSLVPEEETPVNAEENNTKDVKTNIESEAE